MRFPYADYRLMGGDFSSWVVDESAGADIGTSKDIESEISEVSVSGSILANGRPDNGAASDHSIRWAMICDGGVHGWFRRDGVTDERRRGAT